MSDFIERTVEKLPLVSKTVPGRKIVDRRQDKKKKKVRQLNALQADERRRAEEASRLKAAEREAGIIDENQGVLEQAKRGRRKLI